MTPEEPRIIDLYIDESGTTGPNWLPGAASTLVIAANSLSYAAAAELRDEFFTSIDGELKYTLLTPQDNDSLCAFVARLSHQIGSVAFYSINKPYTLLTILLDIWIGQAGKKRNSEYYRDQNCALIASAIYSKMRSPDRQKAVYELLDSFQKMIRQFNALAYQNFWTLLENFSDIDGIQLLLENEAKFGIEFYKDLLVNSKGNHTSLHLAGLTQLISFLQSVNHDTQYRIYHDESQEMLDLKDLWKERCNAPTDKADLYNTGLTVPLAVRTSSFAEKSHSCLQIQMSDIIAGAAADYLNSRIEPNFDFSDHHRKLFDSGLMLLNAGGITPLGETPIQPLLTDP